MFRVGAARYTAGVVLVGAVVRCVVASANGASDFVGAGVLEVSIFLAIIAVGVP